MKNNIEETPESLNASVKYWEDQVLYAKNFLKGCKKNLKDARKKAEEASKLPKFNQFLFAVGNPHSIVIARSLGFDKHTITSLGYDWDEYRGEYVIVTTNAKTGEVEQTLGGISEELVRVMDLTKYKVVVRH